MTDKTVPSTPTTKNALPAAGETTPARTNGPGGSSGARAVPGPEPKPARRGAGVPERSGGTASPVGRSSETNRRPDSPAEMRLEIQATRHRLSGTLDALEARLVHERQALERKKDEIVDTATLKPLREKLTSEPWRAVAIAFVAGYITAALRD